MSNILFLQKKKKKRIVGIMSGTSADAVDVVVVDVVGCAPRVQWKELAFASFPYPKRYREFVLEHSLPGKGSVDIISSLNVLVAHFFADAVKKTLKKFHIPLSAVDLIGSHGQTIHHLPQTQKFFVKNIPSTIAKLTGITTVGNFRTGDMALGGQGAPLVPFFDYLAFRSSTKNRVLINIGGISNITILPKAISLNNLTAFDTGPGNMIVDGVMKKLFGKQLDSDGTIALQGKLLPSLLRSLMLHPYFKLKPPKSTGREVFGESLLTNILKQFGNARREDIVTTLTEFTALSIYQQYLRFGEKLFSGPLNEVIISGGGTKNIFLMKALEKYFHPARVLTSTALGVSSSSKEAHDYVQKTFSFRKGVHCFLPDLFCRGCIDRLCQLHQSAGTNDAASTASGNGTS
jgi:anhydro-N-acetylmuramic acid kinase